MAVGFACDAVVAIVVVFVVAVIVFVVVVFTVVEFVEYGGRVVPMMGEGDEKKMMEKCIEL